MARSRASEWRLRADALLADGEWHRYEEIRREVAKLVPPGVAVRRTEAMRATTERATRTSGRAGRVTPRAADYLVHVGRRRIALDALRNGVKSNCYEQKEDDEGVRWIRLIRPVQR